MIRYDDGHISHQSLARITDERRVKIALLDAAAAGSNRVSIDGIGERFVRPASIYYYLDEKYE